MKISIYDRRFITMNEINDLKERMNNYVKIMCITENNEELNISFEKASDILLKMFDKNYVRIKKV